MKRPANTSFAAYKLARIFEKKAIQHKLKGRLVWKSAHSGNPQVNNGPALGTYRKTGNLQNA